MAERIYTEDEVAALLERAAALQAQKAQHTEHQPGLTLPELEAIAAESGIDPALLRVAASEMDAPHRPSLHQRTGTTATHITVERLLPGPLTPDALEDVIAELRHRYDTDMGKAMGMPYYGQSTTEQIGRSVEWKHASMSGIETRVLIRPRGEHILLRLSQRVGWGSTLAESITYGTGLAGLAALVAGAVAKSGLLGVAVLLLTLLAAIPLIHYADRAWRQKKHRELEALGQRVAALITTAQPTPAGTVLHEPNAAAPFDAAFLNEAEAPTPDRTATRQRTRGT